MEKKERLYKNHGPVKFKYGNCDSDGNVWFWVYQVSLLRPWDSGIDIEMRKGLDGAWAYAGCERDIVDRKECCMDALP